MRRLGFGLFDNGRRSPVRNATTIAQAFRAWSQSLTGAVTDPATIAQSFAAWTQAFSGNVNDSAAIAQTFPPWTQAASAALFPLSRSPLIWIDANVGVTSSAGLISQITDRSGNSHTISQATGANKPQITASDSGWNNLASITFQDTNRTLGSANVVLSTQPSTTYLVCNLTNTANVLDGQGARQIIGFDGTHWYIYAGSTITGSGGNSTVRDHVMIAAVFNGASSALYVNSMSTNLISGNPGAGGWTGAALGFGMTGTVVEFLTTSGSDSLAQRQAMASYFATKYNKSYS